MTSNSADRTATVESDDNDGDVDVVGINTMTYTFPQADFPYTFYNFINATSKSHPHIVAWSECGNYFKIDRHAKLLPSLIGQFFQHSVYQSLRRQMNMYGFHLTDNVAITNNLRHSNWWYRAKGFFCRDNPQLTKIRPRQRRERFAGLDVADAAACTIKKPPIEKKSVEETWTGQSKINPSRKRRIGIYAKRNPNLTLANAEWMTKRTTTHDNQLNSDSAGEAKQSGEVTSKSTSKILATSNSAELADYHNVIYEHDSLGRVTAAAYLSQSFPVSLHQFISDCAKSNPEIVQWNTDHTAFNVEIHHPKLPVLLHRYFQHGNYSSLRRQLNFYGFRRDDEGFYRNDNFSEGNYRNIVSRAARDRKARLPPLEDKTTDLCSNDDLSSLFDHDLSTYDTLKNDDMSFEQMEGKTSDDRSLDPLNSEQPVLQSEALRKFNVHDKVYVRDKDGVLYVAIVRRHLYGPQFHKQVEMGLEDSVEKANEKAQHDDRVLMWHYFVHFDFWNVNFDRWVSASDIFEMSDKVTALAQRISQEHRTLQLEMRKSGVKGKKHYQTVNGAAFLKEWKKRLPKIHEELGFGPGKDLIGGLAEDSQNVSDESDHLNTKPIKSFSWTKAALSNEQKYRQQGLTSRKIPNVANGLTIPFALKKIVVQQWEYINQCQMMPCVPPSMTIRQALNQYLDFKNIRYVSCTVVPAIAADNAEFTTTESSHDEVHGNVEDPIKSDISSHVKECESSTKEVGDEREQEWRDMVDGIAMLFDESLESRLLYREELPQLHVICNIPEYSTTPYSELYGCEHLMRLFIRLPEMLADNLPNDEGRQIMAKVNDFIRFLHKNHTILFTQTHRKLNELERSEQQKIKMQEEKKRKERTDVNDDEVASNKKMK